MKRPPRQPLHTTKCLPWNQGELELLIDSLSSPSVEEPVETVGRADNTARIETASVSPIEVEEPGLIMGEIF